MARGEVPPSMQRPHLVEEPAGHHRVKAPGEALMQHRAAAGGKRPGFERYAGQRADRVTLQLRKPPSGCAANLQSSLNSLAVVGIDARSSLGIEPRELTMKCRPAGVR